MRWEVALGLLLGYLIALSIYFLTTGEINWALSISLMLGGAVGVWIASRFFKNPPRA